MFFIISDLFDILYSLNLLEVLIMNIRPSADITREKMKKLSEELLAVEEDRLAGISGCSLDELDVYLDEIIEEA